jgi:hypothetical protein
MTWQSAAKAATLLSSQAGSDWRLLNSIEGALCLTLDSAVVTIVAEVFVGFS